jgi:hypothetical protein
MLGREEAEYREKREAGLMAIGGGTALRLPCIVLIAAVVLLLLGVEDFALGGITGCWIDNPLGNFEFWVGPKDGGRRC